MEMLSDVDDPRQPSNGTRHDFLKLPMMEIVGTVWAPCGHNRQIQLFTITENN
jgi:hypothetical protein